MEGLSQAIASTCPAGYTGVAGAMFAQSVAAIVAAHCAISTKNHWPKDQADEVFAEKEDGVFDFIIVGAGTAGSLLARELSDSFPSNRIALIEAGEDPGVSSTVPALIFLFDKEDWKYKTQPQPESCQGYINKSCIWSKGKAMGGSSSINAMLYVRNLKADFDRWKAMGNPEWGYENVEKYYDKIENKFDLDKKYKSIDRTDLKPLTDTLINAWNEIGIKFKGDVRKQARVGTMISRLLIADGMRKNTAEISLKNHSDNIIVIKNTKVTKVLLNENNEAMGVIVKHLKGVVKIIETRKEVILSAGSIATPQILMLSGIGPAQHLKEKGISKLISDLTVGKNLQDHIILPIYYLIHENYSQSLPPAEIIINAVRYMLTRKGLLSNIGIIDFMAFMDTQKKTEYPDIQFHHTYIPKNDKSFLKGYLQAIGYKEDVIEAFEKHNKNNDLLGIYVTILHPKSEGEVLLKDVNPDSAPVIKTNYFKEMSDLKTLLIGLRETQKLLTTQTFKTLGIKQTRVDLPFCKEEIYDSDEYWICYAKHLAHTLYHPVGTAKMGAVTDPTSVVDSRLMVKGVKRLRVVDASVMPAIVGGNTMAATLMIAEKAADIIKHHYGVKDEL